jgi:hypothetical protein
VDQVLLEGYTQVVKLLQSLEEGAHRLVEDGALQQEAGLNVAVLALLEDAHCLHADVVVDEVEPEAEAGTASVGDVDVAE